MSMELFLNSAWVMMAVVIVILWLRLEGRAKAETRLSFIALVMLIVILFPVISVSDDLWSLQSPAETNTYQRRDHQGSCPHSIFPVISALPEPAPAELTFGFHGFVAPFRFTKLAVENPALAPIQNRPPPSA
jgi:hypothetical protein